MTRSTGPRLVVAVALLLGFFSGVGFWVIAGGALRPVDVAARQVRGMSPDHHNGVQSADNDSAREALRQLAMASVLGEPRVHAAAATRAESFAVCTGPIDEEVEGLYILDFVSGELQCVVLNFRTGKFSGVFRANVIQDLGIDAAAKRPSYLMVAGAVNFPRGASVARPGNSVVYILDTTTGSYGAYGIPWRRELAATGRNQAAAMMLLDVGRARTAAIRE